MECAPTAEYPEHWEADVVGREGSIISIRPIRPTDRAALQDFHIAQSSQSRYFRFFAPLDRLSESDLDRFTQVDHHDRVALVAVDGERILAVGRYDRVDGNIAEVAFNVADSEHGRGLGSVLLEHLAAAARERGLRHFTADVLPHNAKMLRVFKDAGYDLAQHLDDGVVTVDFTINPTVRQLQVLAEREHRSEAAAMRRIFEPKSILIVDLLDRIGTFADAVTSQEGGVQVETVGTQRDLKNLALRLEGWDVAMVAARSEDLGSVIAELGRLECRSVVVMGGDGGASQPLLARNRLRAQLRHLHMRLIGPRSLGVAVRNSEDQRLDLVDAQMPPEGGLGVFCQSVGGGRRILRDLREAGVGVHSFIAAGHRYDISGNDCMQYWATAPSINSAALVFESIGNPRKFARIGRRLAARIPVIATIAGESGQVVPLHGDSATVGVGAAALHQLMAQSGVLLAQTPEEVAGWAAMFQQGRIPRGNSVKCVTNSRVSAALLRELATGSLDLDVNVLDFDIASSEFTEHLESVFNLDSWDALVLMYHRGLEPLERSAWDRFEALVRHDDRLVIAVADDQPTGYHRGAAWFTGAREVIRAIEAANTYATYQQSDEDYPLPEGINRQLADQILRAELPSRHLPGVAASSDPVSSEVARDLLGSYGVQTVPWHTVSSIDEAVVAAAHLGWPVALKSASHALRHRLDLGGVILNINDESELRQEWTQLRERLNQVGLPDVRCEVQHMVPAGTACVITGQEDVRYGPVMTFGMAGDASQILEDVSFRVPPLRRKDIHEMVHSVKASVRLRDYQGLPQPDLTDLYDLIARVSLLKEENPSIAHLSLNPVVVTTEGTHVLSATIVLNAASRGDSLRRSLPT